MSEARIIVKKEKNGIVLKFESDIPINETEAEKLDDCQLFILKLLNAGYQTGIWNALGVKNIEGDITPKPSPGAEIIDLQLDKMYDGNSKLSESENLHNDPDYDPHD